MDAWESCRTCLSVQNLNLIFAMPEHSDKYSEIILATTGLKVEIKDDLSHHMCSQCINFINESYKFRKKCEDSQKTLIERLQTKTLYESQLQGCIFKSETSNTIDIHDLIDDFKDDDDNITLDEYLILTDNVKSEKNLVEKPKVEIKIVKKRVEKLAKKRGRTKKENHEEKRTKEKKDRVREEIECELCHKVLTSRLSLRNHLKIHTGFDVVCEHCGKKFITRRLLLMHCKAKHGYEKTDKCSFCDYRASNAEQVKIHERLHTGEKPYVCSSCGAGFHRHSSYLQHVAIHLPEKTVQCDQCPARFKSVTLMRIHKNRHRAPQYTYKCRVCNNSFARRRNVARHLQRIHALQAADEHIDRTKCLVRSDASEK